MEPTKQLTEGICSHTRWGWKDAQADSAAAAGTPQTATHSGQELEDQKEAGPRYLEQLPRGYAISQQKGFN